MKNIKFVIILILFVSGIYRLWQIGSIPLGLYWDEVAMLAEAKSIAATGKEIHGEQGVQAILPSYGDYKLPAYVLYSTLFVKVLGANDISIRLPNAVVGILQGFIVYLLIQQLFLSLKKPALSKSIGIVGWTIVAVSPWSIHFSRTGFEGFLGQFLISVAMLSLFYSQNNKRWLVLTTLSAIFAVYSYYSVRFVWPVLIFSFLLLYEIFPEYKLRRNIIKKSLLYLVSFIIWSLALIPLFKSPHYKASELIRLSTDSVLTPYQYVLQSNIYREQSGNTFLSRLFYHWRILQIRDLAKHYSDNLDFRFLFLTGDPNLRHSTGQHGLFLLWMCPLLILGILYLIKKQPLLFFFLLIWWCIALLPASVPKNTPHALRSLNAFVPIVLFMSSGSIPLIHLWMKVKNVHLKKALLFTSVFIICYSSFLFFVDYFFIYPQKSAMEWQEGYKQVAQIIDQEKNRMDSVWIDIGDDRFFLWTLAYGTFSPTKIQSLEYDRFILHHLDNINFKPFSTEKFETAVRPFMVVTRIGDLKFKPDQEKIVSTSEGTPKFVIGIYEK